MIEIDFEGMYKDKRRKIVRESQKRRRDYAKSQGVCVLCCKAKAVEGLTLCEKCRRKHNELIRRKR